MAPAHNQIVNHTFFPSRSQVHNKEFFFSNVRCIMFHISFITTKVKWIQEEPQLSVTCQQGARPPHGGSQYGQRNDAEL
jgi:hypothetical protein